MQHLKQHARLMADKLPGLKPIQDKLEVMVEHSTQNEDYLLDVPFSDPDIVSVIMKLKLI